MEAIVLQTLGDVDGLYASRFAKWSSVENELVCAPAVLIYVKDLVVRLETREDIIGVEKCDLSSTSETLSSCKQS